MNNLFCTLQGANLEDKSTKFYKVTNTQGIYGTRTATAVGCYFSFSIQAHLGRDVWEEVERRD